MTQRRSKGEGGITQRHDHPSCPPRTNGTRPEHRCRGRWQATLDVIIDGRRKRKTIYAPTKAEARVKLAKALRERDSGALVMQTITVEAWTTAWLERKSRPPKPLKPQTMRSYRSKTARYIVPMIGRRKLTDLRAEHIEAMYDQMRDDGLAEATIRQTHAILARALKDAVRVDKLSYNPIDKTNPPGTDKAVREQFTVDQARRVLRAAGDDARWWLALFYGVRQGEVLGLDWARVDLDTGVLYVAETLQTGEDGRLFLGAPKTDASQRIVPMLPQIANRLRLLWESEGEPTAGLVFHRGGKPLQPKRDWQAWRDLIMRANDEDHPVPVIALHAARNSAASVMEAAGIPDRLVMQILGQSQVSTTHRYQRADVERMRTALESAGRLLELD
ncbi:site-specific integrase [Arthrobacter sp. Alg241-R88]|uniref:tyrosine-type recombinase/integrase n=1 Tax=Arthrobacter sp. Alg241-R88 TaxID=2305984 RepID=UPI0013D52475|nr:site-specific integrase [Arthrobacter sp. Alg241-R88]